MDKVQSFLLGYLKAVVFFIRVHYRVGWGEMLRISSPRQLNQRPLNSCGTMQLARQGCYRKVWVGRTAAAGNIYQILTRNSQRHVQNEINVT